MAKLLRPSAALHFLQCLIELWQMMMMMMMSTTPLAPPPKKKRLICCRTEELNLLHVAYQKEWMLNCHAPDAKSFTGINLYMPAFGQQWVRESTPHEGNLSSRGRLLRGHGPERRPGSSMVPTQALLNLLGVIFEVLAGTLNGKHRPL
ncbi:unnamed protein product [Leuciscus chuanchicus]